jgi:uncharacterized membrane protein YoaK (UPF0700 family)
MISDAERRRLDEIERLLRDEDPAFVQRFDERTHTPRTVVLAVLAFLVMPITGAVAGALGGPVAAVLALCAVTAVCVGIVLWSRRARPPRRWR